MGPRLTPDERHWIKWAVIGAIITAGSTAAADLLKEEIKGWLQRRRDAGKEGGS